MLRANLGRLEPRDDEAGDGLASPPVPSALPTTRRLRPDVTV